MKNNSGGQFYTIDTKVMAEIKIKKEIKITQFKVAMYNKLYELSTV